MYYSLQSFQCCFINSMQCIHLVGITDILGNRVQRSSFQISLLFALGTQANSYYLFIPGKFINLSLS